MNKNAQELVSAMTNYVNSFSLSRNDEFIERMSKEHRTLQQSFTRLCVKWLEHVASDEYKTDLRNMDSKMVARQMVEYFEEANDGNKPSQFLPFI